MCHPSSTPHPNITKPHPNLLLSYDPGYVTSQPKLDYASPQLLASVPDPDLFVRVQTFIPNVL